jgi:ribonucleoside-diphosphate reductase alpha chain
MNRERLPNRRRSIAFYFEHEGHSYRATATRYDDGRLAEVFLDTGKINSPLQKNAETSAILVSLLLQHGVGADEILHSISGPIAVALELARAP